MRQFRQFRMTGSFRMPRSIAASLSIGAWGLALVLWGCAEEPEEYVGRPPTIAEADETAGAASDAAADPAAGQPKTATISWTGCGISKNAYMIEAAAAYKERNGVEVIVTGGGATRGIRATAGGTSDIGGSCRHCLPNSSDQEVGAVMTHVAWDALVFFTHKSNPVKGITMDQAKAILLGRISNWNEIDDGLDHPIVRAFRRQTADGKLSGVGYMTRLLVFGDPNIEYTSDALFERSSEPIERFVERTPNSFAVTGVSSAKKRDVKILELDEIYPDKTTIASGRYPLFRPLYLVTKGEPTGPTKKFIDWIVGPEGQAVLSAAGTVSLAEGAALGPRFKHWPQEPGLVRNR